LFNGRTRIWYTSSANPAKAASLPKAGFVVIGVGRRGQRLPSTTGGASGTAMNSR
jgi:hypothetical protein